MSAAGDDPSRAAARVSVIASIGYSATLAGPPAVGVVGSRFTVLGALFVVAGLLAVAILVAGTVTTTQLSSLRPAP
ncbi:hypothetical protein [Actinoplanes sp. TBRC 11911]|uniref:hypothetical protein n=1 Tax=Actinoplanes sp. TBRC 11911 TaxID=2729386 RepID=UPI001B7D5150|nr:hypothetical protein [Actinoplanes sp. TBRC 11911]